MKPLLQDVKTLIRDTVYVKEIKTANLTDQFHFHNAHEIALIVKGTGKRIVGDNIEYFTDGDLIFIGPHLPHASYSGNEYILDNNDQEIEALVIYFHPDWLNKDLLNSSDFVKLTKFLKRIERGVQIVGETRIRTIKALGRVKNSIGLERIIHLLHILDFASKSDEYKFLASEGYSNSYAQIDVERLGEVYKYVMKNFTNTITLSDVSAIAHMTTTSFCKYFKCKTGKPFSSFVNELRIAEATKLLLDPNLTVTRICYSCGFNNLTNFNKTFLNFTMMTPSQYRKTFYNES
jgi:AraC-like DNA-binding protein